MRPYLDQSMLCTQEYINTKLKEAGYNINQSAEGELGGTQTLTGTVI